MEMKVDNLVSVKTRQEWRDWLMAHSSTDKYCWLNMNCDFSYLDAVEEALCFGWIDSTKKSGVQRFSPRSKNSNWTELNRARVQRLEKLGLMTDKGRKCLPDSEFKIHQKILDALMADKETYANFCKFPKLYQKIRIDNIQTCLYRKQIALFETRLQKFIENTKADKMFGPWHDDGRLLN